MGERLFRLYLRVCFNVEKKEIRSSLKKKLSLSCSSSTAALCINSLLFICAEITAMEQKLDLCNSPTKSLHFLSKQECQASTVFHVYSKAVVKFLCHIFPLMGVEVPGYMTCQVLCPKNKKLLEYSPFTGFGMSEMCWPRGICISQELVL